MLDAKKGLKNRWQHGEQNPQRLGWEAGGDICASLGLAPSGPSPQSPSLLASSKSASLWSCQNWRQADGRRCFLPPLAFSFWWCLLIWSLQKVTSCLGEMAVGVLFGPISLPPPPPSFGKPACKQVEAWSLNVSDSKPEVGSASAGQTSFAGVEKRGEGVKRRWDIWNPRLLGTPGRGRGRGPRGGRVGEQGGESAMPPRGAGGCRVPSLWLRGRSLRPAPPAPGKRCRVSECWRHWPPAWAGCSGFPKFAVFQPEPVPSGEPLSHLFSSVGCPPPLVLAVKYFRATWSLVLGWLFFSPLWLPEGREGGGREQKMLWINPLKQRIIDWSEWAQKTET